MSSFFPDKIESIIDFPPNYNEIIDSIRKENRTAIVNIVKENKIYSDISLSKKIQKFKEQYPELGEEFIKNRIIEGDPVYLEKFAKDPIKQNYYEKIFFSSIKKSELFSFVSDISRKEKYLCTNGMLSCKENINRGGGREDISSLDFEAYFLYKKTQVRFLITHKYTKEEGGAQNKQLKEISSLFSNFINHRDKNNILLAVLDGNFYQSSSVSKQRYQLEKFDPPPLAFARASDEIPWVIYQVKLAIDNNKIK